jgi:UDP-2-acetamido-3-amino-2,3-dideoxy-glucuronate N-acetyltransferase
VSARADETAAFVHETAVIDAGVLLAPGVRMWHFVHVSEGARIGKGSVLGQNVFVGRGVRIGEGVKVQNNVSIYEGVELEDEVFLGPSCVFTNVVNPRSAIVRRHELRPTHVRRGASVGANATIVCGHELGEHCLVGAGSVVVRDVLPYELVVGNPARRLGWVCTCGVSLRRATGEVSCEACSRRYRIEVERCMPLA